MNSIDNLTENSRFAKIVIGHVRPNVSKSDRARALVINLFALLFIPVCIIAAGIFFFDGKYTLMYSILGLATACAIPMILNRLALYEYSSLIYTFQVSIMVTVYALYLGKHHDIQSFFFPLFVFPFVFFKTSNKLRIIVFVIFNELCLLYVSFGNHDWIQPIVWTKEEDLVLKIIIHIFLIIFCGMFMFALYHTKLKNEIVLLSQNEKLQKAYKAKQGFLSTMSHEIRTPLNAVISIASLLDNGEKDTEQRKLVDSLKYSSRNLLNIINDILDFSKLEVAKIKLDFRENDLNQLLKNTVSIYKPLANEKGLDFDVTIEPNLAPAYFFDDVKLGQILGNFITNGIKFTRSGSVNLRVKIIDKKTEDDVLLFEVQDTGIGIATDEIPLLYNSFSQIKKDITRTEEGTGLGLAISKELLALYKSEIRLESTSGHGSTFSFELRLKRGERIAPTSLKEKTTFDDKKILLVEDNPINGMVAGKILKQWGVTFDLAANGQIAVDMSEQNEFDLILMDLHMPVMDGFASARLIRTKSAMNRNTPIFALTADVSGEADESRYRFFDEVLAKPIEQEKLHSFLCEYWQE